ncbi:MAG TPA: hypothetical protein DFR83_19530 [Deltaproteobacteria bacterium]|nr:hypothetical protein [Deltaproteobacteria bacterium]
MERSDPSRLMWHDSRRPPCVTVWGQMGHNSEPMPAVPSTQAGESLMMAGMQSHRRDHFPTQEAPKQVLGHAVWFLSQWRPVPQPGVLHSV